MSPARSPRAGAAAGPLPLVLLHALPLDASMWEVTARGLRAAGHRVLSLDLPGFGAAPPAAGPPSLDAFADHVARTLDRAGVHRAALAGCSLGGYVAMAFLRRHPDRVGALALLAARAATDTPEAAGQRLLFADRILDEAARPGLVTATSPALLGATTRARRPGLLARVTESALAARPESVAWAQRAVAARPDSTATLRGAHIPAVVVHGEEDTLVSTPESRHACAALPQGRYASLPGVGHLAPLEAPETVRLLLTELVRRAGAAAGAKAGAEAGAKAAGPHAGRAGVAGPGAGTYRAAGEAGPGGGSYRTGVAGPGAGTYRARLTGPGGDAGRAGEAGPGRDAGRAAGAEGVWVW
ncbi:alpha/beta fold hydrolase [Streptomyces sp. NPDC058486]|uniref:alpha/beta fold hydrolase n=1 Tax=unclassified Streptomyces TaxID=2593676 RepID=UPI00365ADF53